MLATRPSWQQPAFIPFDGARWLATQGHQRLAGLVAHHTGARYEADELGLRSVLDEFLDRDVPGPRLPG
jgi:hypothetical protein